MSHDKHSPGQHLQDAMQAETPLAVVGTINAYSALMAEEAGFKAIYLSGAGVANASFGLPDLGMTTLDNVLEDTRRITSISELPLIVDADTGFGDLTLTTTSLINAGAAAIQIEDQIDDKRCGHRPGKILVSTQEMQQRIKAATDARTGFGFPNKNFAIIARTDAYAVEGLDAAIERANHYIDVGANMIFAEALTNIDEYRLFVSSVKVPVIANITEFGKTPLFNMGPLANAGIQVVLYPLTAFRAMNQAALNAYKTLKERGTQSGIVDKLQTRDELYEILNYHQYEQAVDDKLSKSKSRTNTDTNKN